jgi:putative FmdB family regulatory protein
VVISRYEVILPLYEYQCPTCGRFEVIQKFSDAPLEACPTCGKGVSKLLSAPAIQFKGAGWYVTDYARKPESGGEAAKGGDSPKNGGTKDAPAATPTPSPSSTSSSSPSTPSSPNSSASGSSPSK